MTEKMIPLSVIDALILNFETNGYRNNYDTKDVRDILEEIKKEATFVQSPLEQKILQRIKELENPNRWEGKKADLIQNQLDAIMVDELRKLIPVSGKNLSKFL